MKNWTIRKKLWVLSGCLMACIVLQGGMGYYSSVKLGHAIGELSKHLLEVLYTGRVHSMHNRLRGVSLRAILVADSNDKAEKDEVQAKFEEVSKKYEDYLAKLSALKMREEFESQLNLMLPIAKTYVEQARKIMKSGVAGQRSAAESYIPDFQSTFLEFDGKIDSLGSAIEKSAKEEAEIAEAFYKKLQLMLIFIGMLVAFSLSFILVRDLMKSIREVMVRLAKQADDVKATSADLETASQSLSSATTEQAAALQETASAIEEMNAMVKKSAENASKSSEVATASQEVAGKGKKTVEEMLVSINEISVSNSDIMKAVEHSNGQISEIVKVITEIGNKTKVINDIVFQTKLLSFNASVEAARAGEHGKGFAVVAEEVGNLAQMSGNAAKEISDMLNGSIQKVEKIVTDTKEQVGRLVSQGKAKVDSGSLVAKECAEILDEMVKNVAEVSEMISEISTAASEQAQGVSEITKAMNQLDQTTHENAATSQQAASSAEQLSGQADQLMGVLQLLKNLVDGQDESATYRPMAMAEASGRPSDNLKPAIQWRPHPKEERFKKVEKSAQAKVVGAADLPAEDDPRFQDL